MQPAPAPAASATPPGAEPGSAPGVLASATQQPSPGTGAARDAADAAPSGHARTSVTSGRAAFVALNVVGGSAVLASYVLWLGNPSNDAGALWGTIGGAGRALYTVSMLAAAAGYFAFAPFLLFRADRTPLVLDAGVLATSPRHGARPPLTFHRVNLLLTLVLLPSALWMPLAFEYLDAPSPGLWIAMRTGLLITGLASAGIVHAVWCAGDGSHARARRLALAGALAFTFQTLVLDALVWPRCFPAGPP